MLDRIKLEAWIKRYSRHVPIMAVLLDLIEQGQFDEGPPPTGPIELHYDEDQETWLYELE